jgi:hypothetical protein
MVDGSFETFFVASASAGGAFIGLLFVALSIAPKTTFGHMADSNAPRQQLAEGAMMTMASGFLLSSIALIPGINVGWVALGGGIWGVVTASYIAWRVAQFHQHGRLPGSWGHLLRVTSLSLIATAIYAIETVLGLALLLDENSTGAVRGLALTVIGLYAVATLRAWILLGDPDEGLSGWLNPLQDRALGTTVLAAVSRQQSAKTD